MSKILVECRIPAEDCVIDVAIPFEKPLHEILFLMKELFKEGKYYAPDESTVLCNGKTGAPYDLSRTPEELDFCVGESLLMM